MNVFEYADRLVDEDEPMKLTIRHKAISKQRPRTGRGGHFFTPKETRDFEKYVSQVASTMGRGPYTCPVRFYIHITEPVPRSFKGLKAKVADGALLSPTRGDLDNKVKAVTDALNGIAYIDDSQISMLVAYKSYGPEHLIRVEISRIGISKLELERYENGDY